MESSYVAYKFARWLGIALILVAVYLMCELFANFATYYSRTNNVIYGQFATVFILACIGFLAYNNFVYLQMDDEGVLILRKEKKKIILWKDVKSAFRVFGTSPPIYGMTFRKSKIICFFGVHSKINWYFEAPWILIAGDNSGVVKFVKERTVEANAT